MSDEENDEDELEDDEGEDEASIDTDDAARQFLVALITHIRQDREWCAAINQDSPSETVNMLGKKTRTSFLNALQRLRHALAEGFE